MKITPILRYERVIEITSLELCNPAQTLNSLRCNLCALMIGTDRPIGLFITVEGYGGRVCYQCLVKNNIIEE